MPIYEYACNRCGTFSAMRRMADASRATACPECGAAAPRIISAPRLSLMPAGTRTAHETNERSAHSPHTSKTYGGRHPAGCGCCSTLRTAVSTSAVRTETGPRPWMISH